jgi:tetratricopeptide (TPR) repeat protein
MFVIKEPCMRPSDKSKLQVLTVESPTDLIVLHEMHEILQGTPWYKSSSLSFDQWKTRGNELFSREDYPAALQAYDLALRLRPTDSVVLLNRSATLLKLGQFYRARKSVRAALADHNSEVNRTERLKVKALFRLGEAAYGLREWENAMTIFSKLKKDYPPGSLCDEQLSRCRLRLRESRDGIYDMKALAPTYGQYCHNDVADFMGSVAVADIDGKGKGIIATGNITRGTLLLASQAFSMSASDKAGRVDSHGPRLFLIMSVLQRFHNFPDQTSEFYQLDCGPFSRAPLPDGIADVSRIQRICSINQVIIENELDLTESNSTDTEMLPCGLWMMPSFINHSCEPNAIRLFFGNLMMVRALKDIRQGEEILVDYVPRSGDIRERRRVLLSFNFKCRCAWCLEDAATLPNLKARREQIYPVALEDMKRANSGQTEQYVRQIEVTYPPDARFREFMMVPLFSLASTLVREGNLPQSIPFYNRILTLTPRPLLCWILFTFIRLADVYRLTGSAPDSGRTLKQLLVFAEATTGMAWPELKPFVIKYPGVKSNGSELMRLLDACYQKLCTDARSIVN